MIANTVIIMIVVLILLLLLVPLLLSPDRRGHTNQHFLHLPNLSFFMLVKLVSNYHAAGNQNKGASLRNKEKEKEEKQEPDEDGVTAADDATAAATTAPSACSCPFIWVGGDHC